MEEGRYCVAIRWYYPSASSAPVPCAWKVWTGSEWITVILMSVE